VRSRQIDFDDLFGGWGVEWGGESWSSQHTKGLCQKKKKPCQTARRGPCCRARHGRPQRPRTRQTQSPCAYLNGGEECQQRTHPLASHTGAVVARHLDIDDLAKRHKGVPEKLRRHLSPNTVVSSFRQIAGRLAAACVPARPGRKQRRFCELGRPWGAFDKMARAVCFRITDVVLRAEWYHLLLRAVSTDCSGAGLHAVVEAGDTRTLELLLATADLATVNEHNGTGNHMISRRSLITCV